MNKYIKCVRSCVLGNNKEGEELRIHELLFVKKKKAQKQISLQLYLLLSKLYRLYLPISLSFFLPSYQSGYQNSVLLGLHLLY